MRPHVFEAQQSSSGSGCLNLKPLLEIEQGRLGCRGFTYGYLAEGVEAHGMVPSSIVGAKQSNAFLRSLSSLAFSPCSGSHLTANCATALHLQVRHRALPLSFVIRLLAASHRHCRCRSQCRRSSIEVTMGTGRSAEGVTFTRAVTVSDQTLSPLGCDAALLVTYSCEIQHPFGFVGIGNRRPVVLQLRAPEVWALSCTIDKALAIRSSRSRKPRPCNNPQAESTFIVTNGRRRGNRWLAGQTVLRRVENV